MRRFPLTFVIAAAVLAATACSRGNASNATFASYDAGAVPGGPGPSARFAFGHAPSDSMLARMNRDIGQDGAELPLGHGSVAAGATLFAAQCAVCHGKSGEGGVPPNPVLVGRDPKAEDFAFAKDMKLVHTIGNYWPYATTIFDYVRRAMPLSAPGTLTDDQVYAVTAFLLAANKVIPDSTTLDAASLRAVKMPYRDRFIVDDRKPNAK